MVAATLACGAAVGLVNGLLVGYLRLRAFLTTLVTLIIVRAVVDMLLLKYSVAIAAAFVDSDLWYYFGEGFVLGVPFSVVVAVVARRRRASGAQPDARRLARAGGRRLAPLRAQCRHTGAAGDLPHLCRVGHARARWPACSSRRGWAAPAPIPASASRSRR